MNPDKAGARLAELLDWAYDQSAFRLRKYSDLEPADVTVEVAGQLYSQKVVRLLPADKALAWALWCLRHKVLESEVEHADSAQGR